MAKQAWHGMKNEPFPECRGRWDPHRKEMSRWASVSVAPTGAAATRWRSFEWASIMTLAEVTSSGNEGDMSCSPKVSNLCNKSCARHSKSSSNCVRETGPIRNRKMNDQKIICIRPLYRVFPIQLLRDYSTPRLTSIIRSICSINVCHGDCHVHDWKHILQTFFRSKNNFHASIEAGMQHYLIHPATACYSPTTRFSCSR